MDRWRFRRALTVATASAMVWLSACADRPRPFPDHCAKLGRALTPTERYSKALLHAYADAQQLHLVHFTAFREQFLAANPSARPEAVVAAYLKTNPACCAAVQPWPIRSYDENRDIFGRNDTAETEFREFSKNFRWTHEILIGNKGRANPAVRAANIELQQSDCGETSRHGRG